VVDDYAHHPAEIEATLTAAREAYGRRVIAIWQPHRYSRVCDLHDEFMRSFNDCSLVLVMDVYAAGEAPIDGIDGESLVRDLRHHGHKGAVYTPGSAEVLRHVHSVARKGDVVITLGAGSVTQISYDLADDLVNLSPPTLEISPP
jgi:UDP-N-acetylmuramate--alanine ligase